MERVTQIFLLLVVVNTIRKGDCIRCYSCVSKGNDDCLDPEKFKMGKKICDLEALSLTQGFAQKLDEKFGKVFEVDVFQEGDSIIPQQCFKQVTRIHGEDIVIRGCQVSPTDKMDICRKVKDVAKPPLNVTHCSLCDNDGCNKAPSSGITSFLNILVILILAINAV